MCFFVVCFDRSVESSIRQVGNKVKAKFRQHVKLQSGFDVLSIKCFADTGVGDSADCFHALEVELYHLQVRGVSQLCYFASVYVLMIILVLNYYYFVG